jgi:hypothetical protein
MAQFTALAIPELSTHLVQAGDSSLPGDGLGHARNGHGDDRGF